MLFFSLAFLLGDVLLQHFSRLPYVIGFVTTISLFVMLVLKYPYKFLIFAFLCGFSWSLWYAHCQLARSLPKELEGKTIIITGYISSIPDITQYQTGFLFALKKINNLSASGLIHLSWRNTKEKIKIGDQWKFTVRLKRIHSLMNPGGFDYAAWALQEGIHAQGYIVNNKMNLLLEHDYFYSPINQLRQSLKEKIEQVLPVSTTSPWIYALAIGERHGIAQDQWEVLRNTGTNHLMAIAGLHIGFMSGFILIFVSWLWKHFPRLMVIIPAQHAGAISASIMACIYSALAGFLIPTQRACIMLATFIFILLLRRKIISWQAWSIALLFVLIINPLTVLSESFWLSFGSVAFIIYGVSGRLHPTGLWWKWGRIQWVIALGLIPLSIWLFQQCSVISFIANSIAIPWVGFIIVPLTLLGCFCLLFSAKLAGFILMLADKNLNVLWKILTWLSHISWAAWYQFIPEHWIIITACMGMVILLLPQGFPGRWLGIVWVLPVFLYQSASPKLGEVWFTLLDVGQGLAAVVQTQNHVLVFDAGAHLNDNYDMGNSVVAPFLRTLNVQQINMLVISHGDNDHIGGAYAILKQFPVDLVRTSVPEKFSVGRADYCLRQQAWTWDKVNFEFLFPSSERLNLNNNSSCVLRISSGSSIILLTGDIEKLAEKYLVENEYDKLKANILIAPHHGSKTSAEDNFLHAVNPQYVLFPVGYRNRYHFPNLMVVEKYKKLNVIQYDTVNAGAIQFKISPVTGISKPDLYKMNHRHYWMLSP